MGMRMTWAALAVAGSMAASGPAHAVANDFFASLDWTDPIYNLVDLTPADGIGTSFAWKSANLGTSGVFVLGAGGESVSDWTTTLTRSSSTIVAEVNALQTRLDGLGVATGNAFQEAGASRFGGFVLGPGTGVVFNLFASGAVQTLPGVDVILGASIFVTGPSGMFDGDSLDLFNGQSGARLLSVTLRNDTANDLDGHFTSHVGVNVSVTPVPEPSSYAMLLAGMGLLAGVALRRRQRADA